MARPPHDHGRHAALTVVTTDDDDDRPWLTLTEAAAASGLDREAIRSRARRGLVLRRRDNRGQWLVRLPPELDHGHDRGHDHGPDRGQDHGQDHGQQKTPTTVDHGQGVVTDLLAEVAELRTALAQTVAERDTARAVHDAETALLREALAREADHAALERARADRLEAALAEARRPWLARVLEGLRRRGS